MNNKITPAPWEISYHDSDSYIIECVEDGDNYGAQICHLERDEGEEWADEVKANAALIAAAPIMYEFVEEVAHGAYSDSDIVSFIETLKSRASEILRLANKT
jgi:hypothetical protein